MRFGDSRSKFLSVDEQLIGVAESVILNVQAKVGACRFGFWLSAFTLLALTFILWITEGYKSHS